MRHVTRANDNITPIVTSKFKFPSAHCVTLTHLTIWGATLAPSLFYSGDQWAPLIRWASSLVSEINPWRSENAQRGWWGDGNLIPNWGKTWQFRSSRVPKTIPKVRGSLWASHVLGYRHFLTVSVSLLGPDLFPGVWICQQPTWKGEDQRIRTGKVRWG